VQVFHQVTAQNEAGETETTLDINGMFLVIAGFLTLAAIDSIMDGIARVRAKKSDGPSPTSPCK
jgi:hypothetical protein